MMSHPACFQPFEGACRICATTGEMASYANFFLTFPPLGVAWKYHLRSISGSNGPEAKEVSPLLGSGPIYFPRVRQALQLQVYARVELSDPSQTFSHPCNSANALSQTNAWRCFLSRIRRRMASSSCINRSKVILAGWESFASAWEM